MGKKLKERKLQKKKEEKKVKLLKKRAAMTKSEKEAKRANAIMKLLEEDRSGKLQPFIKDPEKRAYNRKVKRQKTIEKLEANMVILEGLQKQFESEQEARLALNNQLEDEGNLTMQEKMKSIGEQAKEMQKMISELKEAQKISDAEENQEK